MGQRANLIIVENGGYILKYDHWVANRLDDVLFWGPGYALEFFEAQEEMGEDGWLDEVWAEGGAVLDLDKKHLLWWGGEDIIYEILLRRVYLQMQKKVWSDWTIEWAHRGIVDLAEYVGYPMEKVISQKNGEIADLSLVIENAQWARTIGVIKFSNDKIKIFPLSYRTTDYLEMGKAVIEKGRSLAGVENLVWDTYASDSFPTGGFFIDEGRKTVEFWKVEDCPKAIDEIKGFWDEWDISWHRDRFEFQVEKLDGRLVLPQIDKPQLIERLRRNLLREDGRSGLESALDTNEILKSEGMSVRLNQWLFKSHHIKKPLESKKEIWQRIFGD